MDYAEPYTEFSAKYTDRIIVEKKEFCKTLKKTDKGTIIEKNRDRYIFYITQDSGEEPVEKQGLSYHLYIDDAVKIRFEGNLAAYEKLLDTLCSTYNNIEKAKIYGRLRQENANCEFFVMDVYCSVE